MYFLTPLPFIQRLIPSHSSSSPPPLHQQQPLRLEILEGPRPSPRITHRESLDLLVRAQDAFFSSFSHPTSKKQLVNGCGWRLERFDHQRGGIWGDMARGIGCFTQTLLVGRMEVEKSLAWKNNVPLQH